MKDDKVWAICISKIDGEHFKIFQNNPDPDAVRLLIALKPKDDPEEIFNKIKEIPSLSSNGELLVH